jgi:serine/threonine protein kinase
VNENAAVLGLLDTLEHEIVPALERAPVEVNWARAHRVVESLILLIPNARAALSLSPSRFGIPEGGLAHMKRELRLNATRAFLFDAKRALGVAGDRRVSFVPAPTAPPRPGRSSMIPPAPARLPAFDELPRWMPENRVLGAFRIDGPIGHGATGSVFVGHRVEDEHEKAPESFAVKVPLANGNVSEEQFLAWFRDEATAIVSLPRHKNVAHVVAFDLWAKPKPILVMEHVHGVTLEEEIACGKLDMSRALGILDDVAAGLESMHDAGIAHLDVKPSNVVLRKGTGSAVLVDFGLAGRNLRPGCGSPAYGAPEVWVAIEGETPRPFAADVYAFACVMFEVMTGRALFIPEDDDGDPRSQIQMHVVHDGLPPPVMEMLAQRELAEVGALVSRMIDPNPQARPAIAEVRSELARLIDSLRRQSWPIMPRSRSHSCIELTESATLSHGLVEIDAG